MVDIEGYKFFLNLLKTGTWVSWPCTTEEEGTFQPWESAGSWSHWPCCPSSCPVPLPRGSTEGLREQEAAHSQLNSLLLCKSPREHGRIHHVVFSPTIHGPALPPEQPHPLADSMNLKVFRDRNTSEFETNELRIGSFPNMDNCCSEVMINCFRWENYKAPGAYLQTIQGFFILNTQLFSFVMRQLQLCEFL